MKASAIVVCAMAVWMLGRDAAIGQDKKAIVGNLKKELDLLKRENEVLKRENELLKQEIAALKKGGSKVSSEIGAAAALSLTVDNVEYVYQGTVRNGPEMLVTLLATSKSGESRAPHGKMFIVDDEGNKYVGMPQGGFGAPQVLREDVPLKLVWRFGPNLLTKQGSAPSAKIARFASLSVEAAQFGRTAIEFRGVPAVIPKSKAK